MKMIRRFIELSRNRLLLKSYKILHIFINEMVDDVFKLNTLTEWTAIDLRHRRENADRIDE